MLFSKDIFPIIQTRKSRYSASVKHARVRVLSCYESAMYCAKAIILASVCSFSAQAQDIPLDTRANDYFEALNMSFEQKIRAKDLLADWNTATLEYNNRHRIDEQNSCYRKSEGEVIIILQFESDGTISEVYASTDNEKGKCFINTYKGLRFPQPPMSPVYYLQRMM